MSRRLTCRQRSDRIRRADTGPEAVLVQVRCGIEFELNGPPS